MINIFNLGESEHTPVLVSVEKTYCTLCKYGFNYSEVYNCIVSQIFFRPCVLSHFRWFYFFCDLDFFNRTFLLVLFSIFHFCTCFFLYLTFLFLYLFFLFDLFISVLVFFICPFYFCPCFFFLTLILGAQVL